MSGHRHNSNAATQNQGNSIGDRSSVRQSRLYRVHESGNSMKGLLGTGHLSWDADQQEGAYAGRPVYDHMLQENRPLPNGRSNAFQRHRAAEADSYSKSSWETTSSGYGVNGTKAQGMAQPQQLQAQYQGQGQGYGQAQGQGRRAGPSNASSGVASSMQQYDEDEYDSRAYSHSNGNGSGGGGYASMKAQAQQDNYRRPADPQEQAYAISAQSSGNRRTSFSQNDKSTKLW